MKEDTPANIRDRLLGNKESVTDLKIPEVEGKVDPNSVVFDLVEGIEVCNAVLPNASRISFPYGTSDKGTIKFLREFAKHTGCIEEVKK